MTEIGHEALVRRLTNEVWNQGEVSVLDELYRPDAQSQSAATFKSVVAELRAAFPDLEVQTEQQISDGEGIAVRWHMSGTHLGPLAGLSREDAISGQARGEDHLNWPFDAQPTGRRMRMNGTSFLRVRDGKIISAWVLVDQLSALRQLGILPSASRMGP